MKNRLPQGWAMPLLGDVVQIKQGNSKLTKKIFKDNGKYIAFSGSGPDGLVDSYEHEGRAIVLSSVGARCGKCFKAEGKWTAIANTAIIRPLLVDQTLFDYLFFLLNDEQFWPKGGSAQPFVQTGIAQRQTIIPLPPHSEQRRIVIKLGKLLAKVESSQKRLAKISTFLKRFRQSVLVVACRGDLVKEKAKIVLLGDLEPKIQTGPFGSTLHKSDYVHGGIPIVNPMHIIDGRIIPDEKTTVSKATYQRLQNYAMKKGDVIIARRGEMGRCAVVDSQSEGFLCGTGSLFVRVNVNIVDPNYLKLIVSAPITVAFLLERSVGTTMANLNQDILKEIEFPLPSLPVQRRIVAMVHKWFVMADKVEARYKKAQVQVDKLTQSILAKAFRGELVPQDPNDEPAGELLKRIKK